MALQTTLTSPSGATTISFKDERVEMNIDRKPIAAPLPGNHTTSLDMRQASRTFTIRGKLTGATAKADLEALESAAITWASQTGGGSGGTLGPDNSSKLVWGKKSDTVTDKTYYVYFRKLMITYDAVTYGGNDTVWDFVLVLQEVAKTLSANG